MSYILKILLFHCLFFTYFNSTTGCTHENSFPRKTERSKSNWAEIDVKYYNLFISPNLEAQTIAGRNVITFSVVKAGEVLHLDLSSLLSIDSIHINRHSCVYNHENSKISVYSDQFLKVNTSHTIIIYYHGKPRKAPKPPWDGGLVWAADSLNRPWLGVACQGLGASIWWPLKDDLADEPDSMRIHLTVPENLIGVCNGNLESTDTLKNKSHTYNWFVSYPINPYNVTINIANYIHIRDIYTGQLGELELDFYVLDYNERRAVKHFKQVHRMLDCFEKLLGPYPFYRDGYALVETPYWGMEHQSCIAYGNNYINNEYGFDFIIVHETGHEWFGNNMSIVDDGELWINESLTTYAEALYVECQNGKNIADQYMQGHRKKIKFGEPLIGPLGVKFDGFKTSDIYYRGAWMWHSLRTIHNDDPSFFAMIYGMRDTFRLKSVTTETIIDYVCKSLQADYSTLLLYYLNSNNAPSLEYKWEKAKDEQFELHYRLKLDSKLYNIKLPFDIVDANNTSIQVIANNTWQKYNAGKIDPAKYAIKCDNILIDIIKK